jgi:Protein of unknown function (DUF4238)
MRMQYTNVKNAHIVPAVYLRNFAIDGKIGVHLVEEGRALVQPVEKVGTRKHYYRRKRPRDGSYINDIEWSLSELEAGAAPALRTFEERWPLDDDDKSKLAHLFAYQLLRGPRYKEEYQVLAERTMSEFRKRDDVRALSPEQRAAFEEDVLGDSHRLTRMLIMGMTLTSVLASTHWTLVEFPSDVLATSDHPVSVWPGGAARTPQPTRLLGAGVVDCIEYRLPLTPRHGILMTWSEMADDEATRVRGSHHHAMNFNAFTIANADRQWFHLPDVSTPRAAGKIRPLSPQLVPGYSAEAAHASHRRARTRAYAEEKKDRDLSDREIMRVKVSRSA